MKKKIKNEAIILFGFGSIGKRHYQNLWRMGYRNLTVYDPNDLAFENFTDIKRVSLIEDNLLGNFTIAFITNPNHLHLSTALQCAKAGLHLFIEKPLAHKVEGLDNLIRVCRDNRLIVSVGHNMRYHPCLQFIKSKINDDFLGKIYGIDHQFAWYLPYWRPSQDYTQNYAVHKETGGGILLDDIHEFDLLFWFNNYKMVIDYKIIKNQLSHLKIETEDIASAVFLFENGLIGTVNCDYLQQKYLRTCRIKGERGNLYWDFVKNTVVWEQKNEDKVLFLNQEDFNETYINEVYHFFEQIELKQSNYEALRQSKILLSYLT